MNVTWVPYNYNISYFCVSSWVLAFTIYGGEMNVLAVKPTYNRTKTSWELAGALSKQFVLLANVPADRVLKQLSFPNQSLYLWYDEKDIALCGTVPKREGWIPLKNGRRPPSILYNCLFKQYSLCKIRLHNTRSCLHSICRNRMLGGCNWSVCLMVTITRTY